MHRKPSLIAVHPVLAAGDVGQALEFYAALGFTEAFRDNVHAPRYAVVVREGVELHVQWTNQQWPIGIDKPVYRILVDGVDALFAQFMARGAVDPGRSDSPWSTPGDTPWGTREFHVRDPFGNGLQFYSCYPETKRASD